jgi:hypothetical protein
MRRRLLQAREGVDARNKAVSFGARETARRSIFRRMNPSPDPDQRFSWRTFATSLLLEVGVLGLLEWYWYKSSGGWKSSNLVVLLVFAWINAFGVGDKFDKL